MAAIEEPAPPASRAGRLRSRSCALATRIRLPADWAPRPYQLPVWAARERGVKRVLKVWHRRAGKEDFPCFWTSQL